MILSTVSSNKFMKSLECLSIIALLLLLLFVFTGCDAGLAREDVEAGTGNQITADRSECDASDELTEAKEAIKDFLLSGKVFSTSDVVGSGYPEFYYFSEQGTYAYLCSQYGVREEGQLLSQRGEWSLLDNNILLLSVLEEKRAFGGELTEDLLLGQILTGYRVVHEQESYQLAYAISFGEDEDIILPYLLWNKEPFYMLTIPEEDIVPLRILAEEGYIVFEKIF